jgi:HK97 family phage major capsid protein
MDLNALKRDRAGLLTQARALLDTAEGETRDLMEEERGQYDGFVAQADTLEERITRAEGLEGRSGRFASQGAATRPNPQDNPNIGMSDGEVQRYSIIRAIRAAADNDWRNAGLEREASEAVTKLAGKAPHSFYLPHDVAAARSEQRDLLKGTTTAGGFTVATELDAGSFIDMLRNKMVVRAAGATVLDGLVGDFTIPRQSAGGTAYWVAENVAPTESQQTFEQVALSPRTVGAYTDISRKLLLQSSIDVEALVRSDLATIIAIEADRVALHGSGAGSQATGIDHTTGIGAPVDYSTIGLAPTLAHIVALETAVSVANADIGKLAYITNSKVRGKLKSTLVTATYGDRMVWNDGATPLNGYNAFVSNQVSSTLTAGSSSGVCSAVFFGNWGDLLIGMWGSLDVLVDPYTGGTAGTVRVILFQDMDVGVRHPLSFAALLGVLAA